MVRDIETAPTISNAERFSDAKIRAYFADKKSEKDALLFADMKRVVKRRGLKLNIHDADYDFY